MLKVGDKAPEFTLKDTEQKEVSLTDYKDQDLVILFFPLAFTGVCTTELCTIRDDYSSYESLGASVVAISVDSPFSLASFKEQEKYGFPLLSDFNKKAATAYDVLYEEFIGLHGVAKRSAFVVGKDGNIKYVEVLDNPGDLPNFDAIKKALEA